MTLENVKLGVAAVWLFTALLIATFVTVSWTTGPVLAILGLVPPVALFMLWREPTPSMSERISAARR